MAPTRDRRPGFSRRRQYGMFLGYVLAIAGAFVGAVLLVLSTLNPPAFAALRMTVASVTAPVSAGLAAVGNAIAAVPRSIGTHFRVHGENADLRAAATRDRVLIARARAVLYENRRLRALLAVRDRTGRTVVAARLVSSSATGTRRFALLNAGRWQGVSPGQPVRGPDGLIGRVVETGPTAARVLLMTDPESIVPVRRLGDGLPAIAAGRGDGAVDIRSVETTNVVFRRGDSFVTSGTGGIYPPGIPVARIAMTARDTALARGFARPDTLDFALVEQMFMPVPPPRPASAP